MIKGQQDFEENQMSKDRIFSFAELKPVLGINFSRVHLHRLERAGKFPHRIKVSERRIGWLESELERWRKARTAQRDAVPDSRAVDSIFCGSVGGRGDCKTSSSSTAAAMMVGKPRQRVE
jgi:prophage regulatory protein